MKTSGNTILISGGGSGIGAALAQRFHAPGNRVIVAGRRRDALDAVIAGREGMFAMTLDVESAEGIEEFAQRVVAEHPSLNVLINNAGIMRTEASSMRGATSAMPRRPITTNFARPDPADQCADRPSGVRRTTQRSSTSRRGWRSCRYADRRPTYSATKAAIHSYTVALRDALEGKVEVIEPRRPRCRPG